MVRVFIEVLKVFTISNFEFIRSQIPVTSSPMMSGPQFIQPQFTILPHLRAILESYHKLQLMPTSRSAIAERPRCTMG